MSGGDTSSSSGDDDNSEEYYAETMRRLRHARAQRSLFRKIADFFIFRCTRRVREI